MKTKILFLVVLIAAASTAVYFLKFYAPPAAEPAQAVPEPEAIVQAEAVPMPVPAPETKPAESTLADQMAQVYHLEGTSRILKKGAENWEPLQIGAVISAGDQVKTEADGLVEIHYDSYFLNIAKISPNSLAEFLSIEPTKIFVSSGAIYSSLEGLPEGSTYDVITPTAVGGVRSTVFARSYDPSTQTDQTVVLEGTVYLAAGAQDASKAAESDIMLIQQDQQFDFTGEELSSGEIKERTVEPMSSEQNAAMRQMFTEAKERAKAFAGGEEKIKEAHTAWQSVKSDPKKIAAVKAKMEITRFYQRIEEKKETLAQESAPSPAAPPEFPDREGMDVTANPPSAAEEDPEAVNPMLEGATGLHEEMAVAGDVYDMEGNALKK